MDKPIQVSFVLQRDELAKARRLMSRRLPIAIRIAGWLQVGLLAALILLPAVYRPDGELQPFALLAGFLGWMVLVAGGFCSRALAALQFEPMQGKETQYEFDDTGYKTRDQNSEWRADWASLSGVLENDMLFVLASGSLFYTVPKRAFDESDIASLRQLLIEKGLAK